MVRNSDFEINRESKSKNSSNNSKFIRKVLAIVSWAIIIFALFAGGWFVYNTFFVKDDVSIVRFEGRNDLENIQITDNQKEEWVVAPEKPRFLSIPSLGITDARIVEIGVKANNQLDDPANVHDVGWYTGSVLPGSGNGAMLMDGHNTGTTERGVFWALGDVQHNDSIIVERGDGQKLIFKVVEVAQPLLDQMDNDYMAMMMTSADSEKEGLNIITCSGYWIPERNTYSHRTTVRAVFSSWVIDY